MRAARSAREIRIRRFVPTDRPYFERGLQALLREESPFDPLRLVFPPKDWGRAHSTLLLRELRKRAGHILVAEVGRRRAGFVVGSRQPRARGRNRSFDPSRRPGCIFALFVGSAFRRRGIGQRLMGDIEGLLRGDGCDLVHMVALAGNEPALAMYRARGYAQRVLWLGKWLAAPA